MTGSQKKLSFEFFPTRTPEGRAKQVITRKQLSFFWLPVMMIACV